MRTQTLAERLNEHRYRGSIYEHLMGVNGYRPTLDEILKSSNIPCRVKIRKDIHVFEALYIHAKKPTLNVNIFDFESLKLFNRKITR